MITRGSRLHAIAFSPVKCLEGYMLESNKTLVKELLAALGEHDVDRTCACIGDTCNGGGPEAFHREFLAFLTAFPDLSITLEDILAEGDREATRITLRGSYLGTLGGVSATSRPAIMKANHIFRCEAGRIVQRHGATRAMGNRIAGPSPGQVADLPDAVHLSRKCGFRRRRAGS
jgi:predicted ester cyclase